jgi:ATP-dependent DNA helicase DinG
MTAPDSDAPVAVRDSCSALALAVRAGRGVLVSRAGEIADASPHALDATLRGPGLLLVHAPFLSRRLGVRLHGAIFDLAELFAFVHPARFATPTPQGLAAALGISGAAVTVEDEALLLHRLSDRLLTDLGGAEGEERERAIAASVHMARGAWPWAPQALAALRHSPSAKAARYQPWRGLPEWEESPPQGESSSKEVAPGEARGALDRLLARALDPAARETREDQAAYAEAAAEIFSPRPAQGEPTIVVAEAGTGIGKTLGYLAPAAVWARRNRGTVWISTYTKNLQRQIAQTIASIAPADGKQALRTIVRKGRENYLCLLNLEEIAGAPFMAVTVALVGRWLEHSADGDMVGGDFPAWLVPLLGVGGGAREAQGLGLTDRRGECIYGACAHFRRCFIERVRAQTESSEIVVANHAVLMTRAAVDAAVPDNLARAPLTRLVLDEGHHLIDAADDAFSVHLTARELAELRRFLRGPEERRARSHARTLLDRLSDLLPADEEAEKLVKPISRLAGALPSEHWRRNLAGGVTGPGTRFLAAVEAQILGRAARGEREEFGLECPVHPAAEALITAAAELEQALAALERALKLIAERLARRLVEDARDLDLATRARIEAVVRSLALRTGALIPAWRAALASVADATPEGFVDWLSLGGGQDGDTGLHRHPLDPTQALARHLYRPAHGVLITSATLFDGEETPRDRTGAGHLAREPRRLRFPSPFPYAQSSRVIIVRDVETRDLDQLAAAMRVLFEAAGGGALGLFTAISRLRAVYRRLKSPLEGLGLTLYAQHVDEMDPGTLVDIFRSETDSCLLGTDAVREGIDVAGRSLRLLVYERVPWPRPDLLHKARAAHFGARAYEEEIARRRITQAYGRLIRRGDDKGVFVILGAQVPSRLLAGLPCGVEIERTGLAEAARLTAEFLR